MGSLGTNKASNSNLR